MDYLRKLMKSRKTVFNVRELAVLWNINNQKYLKSKIYYWTKNKKLICIKPGIYALDEKYQPYELSAKLCSPSYISLETVLRKEGCIFQYASGVAAVSYLSRSFCYHNTSYFYRKIKEEVLLNRKGIINNDLYSIASLERAFLDMIYLNKDYYFDNLKNINWQKCQELVSIYQNKALEKRLIKYRKDYAG